MARHATISSEHLAADEMFGPCLIPECPNYSGRLALVADPEEPHDFRDAGSEEGAGR